MDLLPKEAAAEWGLQNLPEDKQIEMMDRIGRMIYQAVLVRTLDILSESDQEEFDKVLDNDQTTIEDVLRFLAQKIPTFDDLLEEERQKLKEEVMVSSQ